jgi:hypothetical protein
MSCQAQLPSKARLRARKPTIGGPKCTTLHADDISWHCEARFRAIDMHMMTARAGFMSPQAWTCLRCHNPHSTCAGFTSNPYVYCVPAKSPVFSLFIFSSEQVLPFKRSILAFFPTRVYFFSHDAARVPQHSPSFTASRQNPPCSAFLFPVLNRSCFSNATSLLYS